MRISLNTICHALLGTMTTLLGSCEVVSAAALGSTTRIPTLVPGLPDIIQTTFPVSRSANASSKEVTVSASNSSTISITNKPCTTTCSGTPGSGPNQFDCTTIANSLRSGSQGGKSITLTPFLGTEFAFRSCKVVVLNQDSGASVVSTQKSISVVAQGVSGACNAAHNAGGGECVYVDAKTRITVQHT